MYLLDCTYHDVLVPPITPLPVLGDAISRLSQSLSELTISHASNTASMTNLADERIALEKKRQEMQTLVEKAEKKRSWFSAFREWVETVAVFLEEKVRTTTFCKINNALRLPP